MMLKNLFKSWEILAPNEVKCCDGDKTLLLPFNILRNGLSSIDLDQSLMTYEQAALQEYIQQCVEDRDWILFTKNTKNFSTCEIQVEFTRYQGGGLKADKSLAESMLTAYLKALVAQRTIAPGQWQHFKGDVVDVVGSAKWSGTQNLMGAKGFYELEDFPTSVIAYGEHGYFSHADHGDRVFYSHSGKKWARKVDSFLGLVGPEHPDSEGLLRFLETKDE